MTKETILKNFAHFTKLAEEGGKTSNVVRNELMKSDAQRHLYNLLKDFVIDYDKKEVKPKPKPLNTKQLEAQAINEAEEKARIAAAKKVVKKNG